ncbi:hypothetical protein P152DRAFT_144640 [Eremomyces bilateralis CBS 781.70]|uniref:Uncharacterized protein n=1 Tax=Eremomyces bilateralis CBS 781.70 TaxID=1392243 RepID=A0A6G1FW63_9PEZI|nr:uncharacterized protein P152DRAFT_144640 [Eremomyces bilateralis CBS 781.70]KAF1809968.1 hypothetical protein P152DRAFT_144640 [Eremomyces bilateralis CBS 781.70]
MSVSAPFGHPKYDRAPNRLLSQFDMISDSHDRFPELTPFACQPFPGSIFFDLEVLDPEYSSVVRLYRGSCCYEDDGLVFDQETLLAHWHHDFQPMPPKEHWKPLDSILRKWLSEFERGKFSFSSNNPTYVPWATQDLEEAIQAWETLLNVIEANMPGHTTESRRENPLPTNILDQYTLSSFTKAFLSRARLPSFKYVAPGVTYFTPDLFHAVYSSEPRDSQRLPRYEDTDGNEVVTLILPAECSIPYPGGAGSADREGFARFTVSRRAGLYTTGDASYADGVRLVDSVDSNRKILDYQPPRYPWGPTRSPRLADYTKVGRACPEQILGG